MKKLTTKDFIAKSRQKHGNKYDYSESTYVDSKTNIKIMCSIHGEFWQNPQSHYNGSECPLCANQTRVISRLGNVEQIKQTFIDKSNLIHNNKYDYSEVIYLNSSTKVKIICPKHGIFEQNPHDHSQGHGCAKCVGLDKKDYINNSHSIIEFNDLVIKDIKYPSKNTIVGSVYIFVNKQNNKKYIGKTTMKINNRFSAHLYNCYNSKHDNYFYKAVRKYTWEGFDKYIIFQTEEFEMTNENKKLVDFIICKKEIEFINKFQSNNSQFGYNLTNGGDGVVGCKFSDETKAKMSESRKGKGNSMYGKTLEKNPRSIPIVQLDLNNNFLKEWSCAAEIHNELGFSISRIRDCYNNKCEKYKNFKWIKKSNYEKI